MPAYSLQSRLGIAIHHAQPALQCCRRISIDHVRSLALSPLEEVMHAHSGNVRVSIAWMMMMVCLMHTSWCP